MPDPIPTLDSRFSDPDTQATPWPTTRETLENAQLFWITTVRANGHPHVTPLVAVWLDDALHFCTGPAEQKAHNLTTNPHVVLTTGCNTWNTGLDVMVEGKAHRITDRPTLERLATAWATKWDGQWQFQATDTGFSHEASATALVFAVHPTRILTFTKSPYTQTTYNFD
ncbi:pyridoxamine 5'-phosphate oxidase family protein [Actinomadura spongiicola]|uniref:Pyridoxamine 5'-phosphate oxidase family protein n=1 Tax=Actinomadura spongiicola TaxID=2303421 RepID=A0A372GEA1_9ACTN|nr:pyridoxamine 5'-phosphate oxidase family protein [Actinomadura spongiicola]RFS83393.1 pyridoxamine 5'-phosphate oxidase family protein [Actinomadura spongiicola]